MKEDTKEEDEVVNMDELEFQPYNNSVNNYHSRMAKVQFCVGFMFGSITTVIVLALLN